MSAAVISWMRGATFSRWWSLSDSHLRVAMTLVAMAEERGSVAVAETTGDLLASRCSMSRSTIRRAVDALAAAGFCVVSAKEGRRGTTVITISLDGQLNIESVKDLRVASAGNSGKNGWQVNGQFADTAEVSELVCDSLADLGGRGQFMDQNSTSLGQNVAVSCARDLDLLRSSDPDPDLGSDLRSSTSRDLSNQIPDATPTSENETPPTSRTKVRRPRNRANAERIPVRAWAAADYLRQQILQEVPAAVVRNAVWKAGWTWEPGSERGKQLGEGSRNGRRLSWAHSFRLLHSQVFKAAKAADPDTTEDAAWREIAETVKWLFHGQTGDHKLEVECPDTLYGKWDRIQKARKRPTPAQRGSNGKPDPIQKRRWIPADEWGK